MYEEVPRSRRGLSVYPGVSRLTARRIVLGPFVIGGGVVLAAVGGSVAVAATVFTASTIRASDVPPRPQPAPPAVVSVSATAATSASHSHPRPSAPASPTAVPAQPGSPSRPVGSSSPTLVASTPSSSSASGSPTNSAPSSTGTPTTTPTPTASPAGNATVFVSSWNSDSKQLVFEFASVSKGTGPQHSDVYSIASPRQYTATLAADVHIVSGGQLCPPAGSTCTVDQLIAGAAHGFYAVLAVDPASAAHQILERDNVDATAPPTAPTPNPTPSGAVSISPPAAKPSTTP